ncbi:MAG: hypothetical protein WAV05_04475, partial [Anaerolineales bacterium]
HITTPSTPLLIYNSPPTLQSGVVNWISLPTPNWIQTGWNYYYDPNGNLRGPYQFVETCVNGCYGPPARYYQEFNYQNWGTEVEYLIEYTPGSGNQWCAYINGYQKKCQAIVTPPIMGEAFSEIHVNSMNDLDTYFNNDYYKGADFIWRLLDQNEIPGTPNFPYNLQIFQPYNFRTYRSNLAYLPVIMK